ncbi:MAG: HAD-IA family hydrolase [Bacteroidetes bacterium]|nr:HAD-IA family hydrolase [Bacteroidota bacterium]
MTKIRNIIFDLGGVIINIRSEEDWYKNYMIPLLGENGLANAIEKRIFELLELGDITVNDFYINLCSLSSNKFSFVELEAAWNGRLLAIPEERIDLLYELSQSYSLFLLSNTNQMHCDFILSYIKEKFKKDVFEEVFETTYYSFKLQKIKPHIDIYKSVIQDAALTAHETLFIDDSSVNLTEPQTMGIQTIQFVNDEQFRTTLNQLLND